MRQVCITDSGNSAPLEFADAASLTAHVTGTGIIDVDGLGDMTLTNVDTADGNITVDAAGALVATSVDDDDVSIVLNSVDQLSATSVNTTETSETQTANITLTLSLVHI